MKLTRSALLPYSQAQVFALINDIERYPEFLPYCKGAEVLRADAHEVVGRLQLSAGGFKETLTTRNRLQPPNRVDLEMLEGPVENFVGCWRVTQLGNGEQAAGCKVELQLSFDLVGKLKLASRALQRPIARATDKVFQGFCDQAERVCRVGD